MAKDYDPKEIEKKWQEEWEKSRIYEAEDSSAKPKYYTLIEFPYPSGDGLHVGHVRSYTALDIVSRKKRSEGKNVLYPIGWDAFGLPTENYALKTGRPPKEITKENTDNFRRQLKSLGLSFDWSREINTTDPEYYKWTQWIFLKLLEKGLAYKAKMAINWCPKDKIGLANEEVVDGCCDRCGTPVEKREKEQWMLAITKYADRLIDDLENVDYPERVKIQQRNWIGRSEGAEIDFELNFKKTPEANENRGPNNEKAAIKVFTTRPDTLFGATYLVLAPEHLWVQLATDDNHDVLENKEEVKAYVEEVRKKTDIERSALDKEKTGVELKGVKAINPANGEEIPMFIADYVLPHYGTGAIMAVPAHDERDFEFAKKYNLPIKHVVIPALTDPKNPHQEGKEIVFRNAIIAIVKNPRDGKILLLKWKKLPWTTFVMGGIEEGEDPVEAARREIAEETGYKNIKFIKSLGGPIHNEFFATHKGVNRIAHTQGLFFELIDEERGEVTEEEKDSYEISWVPEKEIVVGDITHTETGMLLERMNSEDGAYAGEGILINSDEFNNLRSEEARKKITEKFGTKKITFKLRDWVFSRQRYWGEPIPVVHCEKCGVVPVPESELPIKLPEVENYKPSETGESPLANITDWVNTTCPKCGGSAKRETDVMPQWAGSSWYYLRYIDPSNDKALGDKKKLEYWTPVDWYNGGMEHTTLHLLYSRFWHKFLFDIGVVPTSEPYKKRTSHGLILAEGGVKMSKSLGNVVNPDSIVERFGADTLRIYEMFMGPFEQAISWSESSLVGPRRFLEKVWKMQAKVSTDSQSPSPTLMNQTIKKVSEDIETLGFNTAVSTLMIFVNDLDKREKISQEEFETLLKLLAPLAPHMTEELWSMLGHQNSIHQEAWPTFDESKLKAREVTLVVQVNGKVRAQFVASPDISKDEALEKALKLSEVEKWLGDKKVEKSVYVPGKLVNFVIS